MSATPSVPQPPKSGGWFLLAVALFFLALIGLASCIRLPSYSVSDGSGGPIYSIDNALLGLIFCAVPLALSLGAFRRRTGTALAVLSGAAILGSGVAVFQTSRQLYECIAIKVRMHGAEAERERELEWMRQANAITPEVAGYVLLFPERVHPTGINEFIRIDGLAKLLKSKWPGFQLEGDSILDPWGSPIRFGQDLDGDGMIGHGPGSTGVWRKHGSLVAIGVYSTGAREDLRWVTKGGVIERKEQAEGFKLPVSP